MTRIATSFWDWIDNRVIVRRLMLLWCAVMTHELMRWSMDYALTSDLDGGEIAMVIAAVNVPLAAFQASVFKMYSDQRPGSVVTS